MEFLAVWEELHNPDFNRVQFEAVRSEAGLNRFIMTPTKWIEQTNAIGIVSKAGRYGGGTYAHSDIAMAFATWISPEFQLYIMKDYRRLKQDENSRLEGRVCYGGLDLSSTTDITAFVLVLQPEDEDDKYIILPYFWIPEDNIYIKTAPAGNIKADKAKSTEKIEGAVATIMALDRAIRCGNTNSASVYDDRGILFV